MHASNAANQLIATVPGEFSVGHSGAAQYSIPIEIPAGTAGVQPQLSIDYNSQAGITSHEHLDGLGIIHMNGRVYDPKVGRFLSADPFAQDPHNVQSLNRYAYVLNNPLNATDPSGFFFRSINQFLHALILAVHPA